MRPTQIDIRSENVFWGRQLFADSLRVLIWKTTRAVLPQVLVRVITRYFVDRLLPSEKSDPRALHEITPTKGHGKLEA